MIIVVIGMEDENNNGTIIVTLLKTGLPHFVPFWICLSFQVWQTCQFGQIIPQVGLLSCSCSIVSFAAIFWMSCNAPPKVSLGEALRGIKKTAAKEITCSMILPRNVSKGGVPLLFLECAPVMTKKRWSQCYFPIRKLLWRANTWNISFQWSSDPYHVVWHQLYAFHLPTGAAVVTVDAIYFICIFLTSLFVNISIIIYLPYLTALGT